MFKKPVDYYLNNSPKFGWGQEAKLDQERVDLLREFIFGKKVLDIGCAYGLYVDKLFSLGFKVWGVDLVEEFIKKAQQNKKGTFLKAAAEKLPFADSFFDTVFLFDILEHGRDTKILKEAKRVTKKKILVIVPRQVDQELANAGVVFRHYIDKTHFREYQEKDFEKLAKSCDLKLINLQPVHNLNNKIIFIALFRGPIWVRDIVRKVVFWVLPRKIYATEYFAVFEKS